MFFRTALSAVCLFLLPVLAYCQPTSDQVQQLQDQLRSLQSQLEQMSPDQQTQPPRSQRVTSLGASSSNSKRKQTLIMQVYDLSDLFSVAPQYPARAPDDLAGGSNLFPSGFDDASSGGGRGGGGGLGGGIFSFPAGAVATPQDVGSNPATVSVARLVNVMHETISPDDWEENGGECRVAVLGNSLIVSCYPGMHSQIQELLNLFRKKWGSLRTIAVQAYWCWLTPQRVQQMIAVKRDNEHDALDRGVAVVDLERWKEFFEAATGEQETSIAYSAAITSHNGQTVYSLSGQQTSFVANLEPVIEGGSKPVLAYQPVIQSLQQGAALQVTPVATRGGNFVILDVHSRVNELKEIRQLSLPNTTPSSAVSSPTDDSPGKAPPQGVDPPAAFATFQVPSYSTYRISTTVRIPKNNVVLVGGMTYDKSDGNGRQLYLFVKASVHDVVLDEN